MKEWFTGDSVIKLASVDSTNNFAADLIRQGKGAEGTVILADYQTKGRGQGSNNWQSETGLNLLCSFIICPESIPAERQFYLSMCISNAVADMFHLYTDHVAIKWPNDILIRGKKAAGLLIENTVSGRNLRTSIIGTGININQQEFPDTLSGSTSLCLETGISYSLQFVFDALVNSMKQQIQILYHGRYAEIRKDYLNRMYLLNAWADYSDASGPFEGRIFDISESGQLMVMRREGGKREYGFKEIAFKGAGLRSDI
jgi:BirA family biotin operon repressor/biotin-[acetyl-CoA-carboxylase] ligase